MPVVGPPHRHARDLRRLYQTGQKVLEQGAIEARDMTTEAAITKLMWALGQTDSVDEVRRLFSQSLAGEMAT